MWGVSPPAGYPELNPSPTKAEGNGYYKIDNVAGGAWHDYANGYRVFVATPQPVTPSGGTAGPAPAPPAPAPPVVVGSTPQPITGSGLPTSGSTGGVAGPAPAPPAPVPAPTPPASAPTGGSGTSTAGNGVFTTLGEQEKMLIGSLSSGGETLTGQIGEASKFLDAVKSATAKQAITPAQDVSLTQNVLGAEIQAVNAEASKFQANGASITASDQTQLKDQLAALNQQYAAFGNPDMGTASGQQKNLLKTQLDQLSTTINGLQVADSSGGTTTPTPVTLGGGVPAPSSGQGNDPNAGSTGSSSGGSQSGSSSTDNSLPTTGGSSDSGAPAGGGTHTVVHGDTMWGIARASGMPLSKLEALNPQIKNPELIFPGQQINLGGASDASVTSGGGSTGTDAGGTHTVVHGDTMWGIAQSNGMPLSKLEALNPQIKNPELITPGQQLNLGGTPAAASTPAAGATDGSDGSAVTQSSAVFPRSSSYQTPGAASQTETSADAKPSGWANGSSSVPSDPAKGVIEVVTNPTTDPLKINQNKGHSV